MTQQEAIAAFARLKGGMTAKSAARGPAAPVLVALLESAKAAPGKARTAGKAKSAK